MVRREYYNGEPMSGAGSRVDKKTGIRVSLYELGFRYCSQCKNWYKTSEKRCKDCGEFLRWTPKNYAATWYVKQKDNKRVA